MIKKQDVRAHTAGLVLALSLTVLTAANVAQADDDRSHGKSIVGTWYLALDTVPFGLPPGFPLSGLAIFNRDGTYQLQDGGDFGQATFINTQNSIQFGAWRKGRRGTVIGTALFLEADLPTGEVLRWQKVDIVLDKIRDRNVVTGSVTVSILECSNMLPIPTPLTCPDPIESAGDFVVMPPSDISITLKRLSPGH